MIFSRLGAGNAPIIFRDYIKELFKG